MRIKSTLLGLFLSFFIAPNAHVAETKGVVVTIKPLHSLVSAVMGDTGEAKLLLSGTTSPHNFQLKPSQIKIMQEANVIFYIDNSFETFLSQAFETLPKRVRKVAIVPTTELTVLSQRQGGAWEKHKHQAHQHEEEKHHGHGDSYGDMHVWLDLENAIEILKAITKELSALYLENRDVYKANARQMIQKINALDRELKTELASVKDQPFIVFHDAYQYFERAYELTGVGSIMFEPDEFPSPNRIREVRAKLQETNARCVFREPQFSDRLVKTVIEGTTARSGTLDPLGANLEDGAELYAQLLRNLAKNLKACLS